MHVCNNGTLFNPKKKFWLTWYNKDEPWRNYADRNKPLRKAQVLLTESSIMVIANDGVRGKNF